MRCRSPSSDKDEVLDVTSCGLMLVYVSTENAFEFGFDLLRFKCTLSRFHTTSFNLA